MGMWYGHPTQGAVHLSARIHGDTTLPAMVTMALVPLRADQDLSSAPEITHSTEGDTTTWALPAGEGSIGFVTSPDDCSVSETSED